MAWQNPNGLVQAMHSIRQAAPLRPVLQRSVISRSPIWSSSTTTSLPKNLNGKRTYATEETPTSFTAAPPLDFKDPRIRPARLVPASPSYFSGNPKFIDHLLNLEGILAANANLPTVENSQAPRMAWLKLPQFRDFVGEQVPTKKYKGLLKILQRLNRIDPELMPENVGRTIKQFVRPGNPYANKPAPATVDEMGRARGRGKRKSSSAVAFLVEGDGEVRVNGKTLVEAFPRVHDRESATWALRSTSRLDKYNVWAQVQGGGTTGQAEAITLAVARALLVHEPALKPALRKAGVITVDARRVERKKPGHVKARKMPTWVKR
ncbi:mitochondrial 37S ribosomal protein uS9m [Aspergillus brunneoviolaceus CBS 621.78]|uniref:Small ribosomal subunit protein uS9m n=2 Tax=Aspergillus TaxID=5052 RepID=A0A8G1RY58_9EURO|nr:hypothetical protein BO95DRAFT_445475 [Aspergillus brunneoviolaceus CBS 621.78]XP_040803746.1 uncharacterized protein BO72DRAFT_446039 [Aspergillus fijiensis CBS 313.89]RAH42931.1 hypothetical protein BO95DRAFT_445475 [Aspergillus brunneoviolaceus CBS 621.78]RAK79736.1 hypothetical protein BO72DRAFT_446039 [Aspergillus fijiensis CBS 313.89]